MTLQEIRNNVKNGIPVTEEEYAYLLRNDPSAFFGFLVSNNPGQLNDLLRHKLNYTELSFAPDQKAIARLLDIIIDSKNQSEFDFITENVKIDTSKISPELLEAIQRNDYNFNIDDTTSQRTSAAEIGSAIGNFLNPIFGSTTTTTTTSPASAVTEKTGSKGIIVVFVLVVLVVGALLIFKKQST